MNDQIELFELEKITDNPLFEGFAFESAPSLLGRKDLEEDLLPGFGKSDEEKKWKPVFLSNNWKPPKVIGRVAPFNDFPCVNMMLPVFSHRACDVLKDFLEPNGELLPLDSDLGQYYLFNITKIIDALDSINSIWESWCDPPTSTNDIDYFVFRKEKLVGQSIFRIFEIPFTTIVTKQFVNTVQKNGLNGFQFKKIWPFPPGVDWRKYNKIIFNDKQNKHLKQNSLVLILMLAKTKPNIKEKKQIQNIENSLDAQLMIPTIDAPYWGRYEGSDLVNGEFRLFLSCPNADKLVQKLIPWLKEIEWDNAIYIMKRYGDMYNAQAEEKMLDL